MPSAHERVGIALDLLTQGIYPYFERELRRVHRDAWQNICRSALRQERPAPGDNGTIRWDALAILTVMWDQWNAVFRPQLSLTERSLVGELREFRNKWAHQTPLDEDDAYRVCDSVQRLLLAVGAEEAALSIDAMKWDILREKLGRKLNQEIAQSQASGRRMIDVALYSACAVAMCAAAAAVFGARNLTGTLIFSAFVLFAFAYLIWQRLTRSVPIFGIHECPKCRKVVYTEVCPYCDPAVRPTSAEITSGSSLKLPQIPALARDAG